MDTQNFKLLAAIWPTPATGVAVRVVDVRLHRAAFARLHVGHAGAHVQHFDAELVAGDARVAEKRHLAEITADIGATDPDTMHAHEGIAGPRFCRARNVDAAELFRGVKRQRFHRYSRVGLRCRTSCGSASECRAPRPTACCRWATRTTSPACARCRGWRNRRCWWSCPCSRG